MTHESMSRFQLVYVAFERGEGNTVKVRFSGSPPTCEDPMAILIGKGILPDGDTSFELSGIIAADE